MEFCFDKFIFIEDSQEYMRMICDHIDCIVFVVFERQIIFIGQPIFQQGHLLPSPLKFKQIMLQYFSQSKQSSEPARYSCEDFLFRWKKLERVIQRQQLDGLLLIAGMDGNQLASTSHLFNWLFLGLSGQQIFANRYLEQKYAETMLMIGPEQSFLFLPPQSYQEFQHFAAGLQNCVIVAPTEAQFASRDQFQIIKIAAFYRMVAKSKKIGFFLQAESEAKSIQKWPIIQSFALEPVGRTFFSLKYQVSNINSKVSPLFRNFDKHSLRELIDKSAYALEGQVKGSTQCIQYTPLNNRKAITQLQLQQPLFQAADITGQGTTQRPVRVLFGRRTQTQQNSSATTIEAQSAFHFTVEHFDPITQLQVWRTYFFEDNLSEKESVKLVEETNQQSFLVKKKYVFERQPNQLFGRRKAIIQAYLGLVQSVLDAISTVSKDYRNLTVEFLQAHISSKLSIGGVKGKLQVWLQSFDALGQPRPIDFKDSVTFKLTSTFYLIKSRLNGVQYQGTDLGSLSFSQGFLLQQGCYLLLTKETSYFDFWRTASQNYSIIQRPNPNIQFSQLGLQISGADFRGRIFIPLDRPSNLHISMPILSVKYYFHQNGFRFFHEKLGWKVILYSQLKSATMVNRIEGQWVLFQLGRSLFFQGFERGAFAMQFRGKAYDYISNKSNTQNSLVPITYLDAVPSILSEDWGFTKQILKKDVREGAFLHQHQILQREFLWAFIEAKQLMILNPAKESKLGIAKDIKLAVFRNLYQQRLERRVEELQTTNKTQIVIVNGTYATGKKKFADNLAKFGSKNRTCHVFSISSQNLYSKISLESFTQMLKEFIQERKPDQSNTFIVVIPSWLNCCEVLPILFQSYHIRSVICEISASNFFSSCQRELTENVLTFALPGYAQTIVLDCQAEDQALLSTIMRILWSFAKDSRVVRATNGIISTGICGDIIGDNSYSSEYQKFLRSKYAFLYRFDQLSQLTLHYLEFPYPLRDSSSLAKLSELEGFLLDKQQLAREIAPKKLEAEASKDELMEGLVKLEQVMMSQGRRERVTRVRSCKGVIRTSKQERVEVLWANGVSKQRILHGDAGLGLCILAKNYEQLQMREFLMKLTQRDDYLGKLKQLRKQEELSEEQRTSISRGGKDLYLSDGQFYDGYFYRDVEGHILKQHPQLSRLIAQWLAERNADVERQNKEIKASWDNYCKKYE